MLRGVFVTGTGTGVGKTVAAAALMQRFRAHTPMRYWKPIQTGIEEDDDTAAVQRLGECREDELFHAGVRLKHPVSPHLAAQWSGMRIDIEDLARTADAASDERRWVVEGAGGVLVPVNDAEFMTDLMARLGMPAVIVAGSLLGSINHTLLTIEALRHRAIAVSGVIMIGDANRDNRVAIERYGGAPVLGEMPRLAALNAASVREWAISGLDPEGRLYNVLQ